MEIIVTISSIYKLQMAAYRRITVFA